MEGDGGGGGRQGPRGVGQDGGRQGGGGGRQGPRGVGQDGGRQGGGGGRQGPQGGSQDGGQQGGGGGRQEHQDGGQQGRGGGRHDGHQDGGYQGEQGRRSKRGRKPYTPQPTLNVSLAKTDTAILKIVLDSLFYQHCIHSYFPSSSILYIISDYYFS